MGADVGLTGLATMGRNLALNMARSGFEVAVHNRTTSVTTDFVEGEAADDAVTGHESLADLVAALSTPRVVVLMVAARAVDPVIDELAPLLDPGDVIVDGGNSDWRDTERRLGDLAAQGIHLVGAGISGGEDGALHGPSIMVGGSPEAWERVGPVLTKVAAEADDGTPCCAWLGPGGAGHFVKMVHNGIEYGDMQLIAETYDLMRADGVSNADIGEVFATWNEGRLASFLVEITADILRAEVDGECVVEQILDSAGQKGTGRWTAMTGLELAQPVTVISEAVTARVVSALVEERKAAADIISGPDCDPPRLNHEDLEAALWAAKLVCYSQGFGMLAGACKEWGWDLDLACIAKIWRAGCIIRADMLDDIVTALDGDDKGAILLVHDVFAGDLTKALESVRRVVAAGVTVGVPLPAHGSALAFVDGYRRERGPAALIQAQRDYFGAHTYSRLDSDPDRKFHTRWAGDLVEVAIE